MNGGGYYKTEESRSVCVLGPDVASSSSVELGKVLTSFLMSLIPIILKEKAGNLLLQLRDEDLLRI